MDSAGSQKIQRACSRVAIDERNYLWADTCCISKSSSAELSKAIISMFQCESAAVCYAYLTDVLHTADDFRSSRCLSWSSSTT